MNQIKYKLRFFPATFKVYSNKVVICKYRCFIERIESKNKLSLMVFSVQGKSVCSIDDIFDEQKGKKLSEKRARIKAYTKFHKWINKNIDSYENSLDGLYIARSQVMNWAYECSKEINNDCTW